MLLRGQIDALQSDFISVLGQSVFGDRMDSRFARGTMIAVYGEIDTETGGIVNASVVAAEEAGFAPDSPAFLTGMVDAVDGATGKAVVSGLLVDYNALLSNGIAPRVGDQVSITGRHYEDLGVMVAVP